MDSVVNVTKLGSTGAPKPPTSITTKSLDNISSPALKSSSKALSLKGAISASVLFAEFLIASFNSLIKPAEEVSQYISKLDIVGAVSSIARFSIGK